MAPCDSRAPPTRVDRREPRVLARGRLHALSHVRDTCQAQDNSGAGRTASMRAFSAPETWARIVGFFLWISAYKYALGWTISRFWCFSGSPPLEEAFLFLSTTLRWILGIFGGRDIGVFYDAAHFDAPSFVASTVAFQSVRPPRSLQWSFEPIFMAVHS